MSKEPASIWTQPSVIQKTKHNYDKLVNDTAPQKVKEHMKYRELAEEEKWRLPFINDLLLAKEGQIIIPNFDSEDINRMLNFVCSS